MHKKIIFFFQDHKLGWFAITAFLEAIAEVFQDGLDSHKNAYDFLRHQFVTTVQANESQNATMLAIMGKYFKP